MRSCEGHLGSPRSTDSSPKGPRSTELPLEASCGTELPLKAFSWHQGGRKGFIRQLSRHQEGRKGSIGQPARQQPEIPQSTCQQKKTLPQKTPGRQNGRLDLLFQCRWKWLKRRQTKQTKPQKDKAMNVEPSYAFAKGHPGYRRLSLWAVVGFGFLASVGLSLSSSTI